MAIVPGAGRTRDNLKGGTMKRLFTGVLILALLSSPITANANTNKTNIDIYKEYAAAVAESYNISPALIQSIIMQESSFNPNARNGNCKGLMQIHETYHKDEMKLFDVVSLYEPFGNIDIGVYYINQLIEQNADEYGEVEISYILDIYSGNSKAEYNRDNGILSKYASEVLERAAEYESEGN